ncbi:MAG: protein kinase, partial [Thermoanaerobaculia bacterium]
MKDDRPAGDGDAEVTRIGAYRIEATLGQGGMGEVYLARDERLDRHVALKRIRADLPVDEHRRARFRREARAVARLSHPAIVQIFDLLETEDGDCIVMERVEGTSLEELIARGEIDADLAVRLGAEIADGLAEAHAKGLVHRDLKPENVIVTPSGHAKILDFGLARTLWFDHGPGEDSLEEISAALTQAGTLVGTVHAMSPEQAGGRSADHRSDLFSLGGLLYEMLTGKAPFRGDNLLDTLRRVTSEEPESLAELRPDLPADWVELVERLLAKAPEDRPQNARVVADALERLRSAPDAAGSGRDAGDPDTAGSSGAELANSAELAELPTGDWPPVASTDDETRAETVVRTLLMVELCGRAELYKNHGEAPAVAAFARSDRRLRDLVAVHGGVEVEKGEIFVGLFERPIDAVSCALAFHRALPECSAGLGSDLRARAAVHLGEVVLRRNPEEEVSRGARPLEVEGLARVTAARLLSLAAPCQTLATHGAFDLARRAAGGEESRAGDSKDAEGREGEPRWLAHGRYFVDGVDEPLEVCEVGIDGLAPLAAPKDSAAAQRVLSPSEERMLGWRPAVGQTIPRREHWTLRERVGEGGFGEVWLARHKSGERRVFKFCFEAQRLRALKREVTLFRLLKETLGHRDDIARILDWHFDDAPYFVESEYTEGGNLVEWAAEQGGLGEVPLETRLELVAEVAEALGAAHSVGILHKDVKPENVLVTHDREGRPRARLTDFGIGLLTERERLDAPGFTALGFTETVTPTEVSGAGTLGYLAPELVEGKAATVQADVYSLGVLLYQMVAGDFSRSLAPGWRRDVADEILAEDVASFTDGRPERRPASALDVAERIRTLDKRRRARAEKEARRLAFETSQRRRRLATTVASVTLAVLAIVTVMAVRENRARQDAEASRGRAAMRQSQAEDLIGFMLGDLREKLDPVGRLDILDEVGAQAMEYFAAVPEAELSDEEVARRSQALRQIGEVRIDQGRLAAAIKPLDESLALAQ